MIKKGSIETTQELMKAVDVVVATGGGAMVKSAYSSGRPSFGVGAGNVPVIIDRDVDVTDAVEKIVLGASFDNGIICSHEQFVLAPEEKYAEVLAAFKATARCGSRKTKRRFRSCATRSSPAPPEQGRRWQVAAPGGALAGVDVPESARIILLPADGAGAKDVLAKEKLCPVVAILPYKTFQEAVAAAKANLLIEGAGHSAALHSNNEGNIRCAGVELPSAVSSSTRRARSRPVDRSRTALRRRRRSDADRGAETRSRRTSTTST